MNRRDFVRSAIEDRLLGTSLEDLTVDPYGSPDEILLVVSPDRKAGSVTIRCAVNWDRDDPDEIVRRAASLVEDRLG